MRGLRGSRRDAGAVPVRTTTRGNVPHEAVPSAVEKIGSVLRLAHEPVLFVRVTLSMAADPAVAHPAAAQAMVDLNGRPVNVRADAETIDEAMDLLRDRMRARLEHAMRDGARRDR